jgi:hypothetical protein
VGFKTIRTSDLSGKVLKIEDLVNVIVRSAPGLDEARQLDASRDELEKLVTLADLVNLEIRHADGKVKEVSCTAEEFAKVVKPDVLKNAPGLRGRRPGQRPGNGGG